MTETERAQVLAGLTARFAASYIRAMGSRGTTLSYPRVHALEVLGHGPAIMRDLAVELGTTARNVTAIVDALEDAGFVSRSPHPTDRRATVIGLTQQGRAEIAEARCQALGKVVSLFDALSLEEQQRYADLLGRLLEAFCH